MNQHRHIVGNPIMPFSEYARLRVVRQGVQGGGEVVLNNTDTEPDIGSDGDLDGTLTGFADVTTARSADCPPGMSGRSILLDGTDDYIKLPSLSETGNRSVAAWIKLSSVDRRHIIFGQFGGYVFFVETTNQLAVYAGVDVLTFATTLSVDTWYHVAATVNAATTPDTHEIWLNGSLLISDDTAGDADLSGIYAIGDQYENNENFHGRLKEVRLTHRVLSEAEIGTLASGGHVGTEHRWTFN